MSKDFRSQLAKARDEWFESEEGKRAMEDHILYSPTHARFLKDRLETAFLAGATWAEAKYSKRPSKHTPHHTGKE